MALCRKVLSTVLSKGACRRFLSAAPSTDIIDSVTRDIERPVGDHFAVVQVCARNRPNQEILVPDWLITSHVTYNEL